jgi:hypothetical protein
MGKLSPPPHRVDGESFFPTKVSWCLKLEQVRSFFFHKIKFYGCGDCSSNFSIHFHQAALEFLRQNSSTLKIGRGLGFAPIDVPFHQKSSHRTYSKYAVERNLFYFIGNDHFMTAYT